MKMNRLMGGVYFLVGGSELAREIQGDLGLGCVLCVGSLVGVLQGVAAKPCTSSDGRLCSRPKDKRGGDKDCCRSKERMKMF